MIIKRIGVLSCAKVVGATYAALGLVIGFFVSIFSMLGIALGQAATEDGAITALVGALFGLGAIVFFPLFYGLLGMLGGALSAVIYNLVAGAIGGLEIEFVSQATVSSPGFQPPAPPAMSP